MRLSSTSRSAWASAFAVAIAWALPFFSTGASAQSVAPTMGDPKKCVVILDGMGDVGFRISDSQVIADGLVTAIRKRVGFEGVHYAGVAESAAALKKMLATPEGTGSPQEAQLAWFKQCEENAPWRLKARFGTNKAKKGGALPHWVTVSCRKKDADKDAAPVEQKKFEGKTFLEARDAMVAAMPAFCGAIPSVGMIPTEGSPPVGPTGPKKPDPKPWTPPPRRD